MSFPASWARIPVTATYLLRDDFGTPATGRVEFRSSQIVVADGSIIVPVRVTATLDSAGHISLVLPATDDPDIQPNSWTWSVTEVIDRQPRRTYSLAVPHTASSIDLSSISPIPPGSPVYDYLLTSAIGVTVAGQGDLDVLDGRVTALEGAGGGGQLSDDTPESLGTAAAGVGTEASRSDHVHPMPTAAQVGADISGAASSAITAHKAESDPHPQYATVSEAGAAAPVQSVAGRTGYVTLTTTDIGGLGTAATANTADFATAAQGATADTALQPEDGLAELDSAAATKLAGIATGATANATDAQLRDRATHTGTQPSTTIEGLGDAATLNVGTTSGTVAAGDDARLSDSREWTAPTVTQEQAEADSDTQRRAWTAQRVWQAIGAWWAGSAAKTKLDGIAPHATAGADWLTNIANKPTLGTAAAANTGDFATSEQGAKADTALQAESDPTVPTWAKQPAKPTYTAAEVGAAPESHNHTSLQISDSTVVGRAVLTAADAAAARNAIGVATAVSALAVQAETYGALGDGANDDSDALLAAIATGRNVSLQAGKTYMVSKPLVLAAGQHLYGNGATIKRAAQATTTTTTGITSGSTNAITVADASAFRVGQQIAVYNGANNSGNATIQTIVGSTITVASAFTLYSGSPFSGTTTVALSFNTIIAANDGVRVCGLEIDGNRAAWTNHHWETVSEVYVSAASDVIVDGCYIHDGPCEGIQEGGGLTETTLETGCRYTNNVIARMGGNGIHLSGSGGTLIQGNRITDCTLDASNGHVGGCVTFSWGGRYTQIRDNYFARARCGVGEITNSACDHASIHGNTFVDIALTADHIANGYLESFAIEVSGSTKNGLASDVTVAGNKFIRCSPVIFRTVLATGVTAAQVITGIANGTDTVITCTAHPFVLCAKVLIAGVAGMTEINGVEGRVVAVTANTFTIDTDSSTWGTYTSGGTATGLYPRRYSFTDNMMLDCDGLANSPITGGAVCVTSYYDAYRGPNGVVIANNTIRMKKTTTPTDNENAIYVAYSDNVTLSGNRIHDGYTGINIHTCTNINVCGNNLHGQYFKGILGGYSASSGLLIANNVVVGEDTASASNYECINVPTVATVIGNVVSLSQGHAGILIAGAADCVVCNNAVTAGGTAKSIRIGSGSTRYMLSDNKLNIAITNDAAGAGNFGTATIASGAISIAVTHNVGYTPEAASILVTPTKLSNAAKWWVSAVSSTTFTITVNANPGAGTAMFSWRVI